LADISRFLRNRLSPEGVLGLHLTVGALLMIGASAVFGAIAEDVVNAESITLLDVRIAQWLHLHATAGITHLMLAITYLHGLAGIALLSSAVGLYLWRRRAWYWLLSLVIAVAGGSLINIAMKYAFHRARPTFDDPLMTLATYSFPSGHTAGSTAFYGVLACMLMSKLATPGARALVLVAATFMIVLVGCSRMYLGVHYFSDVLGAIAEGMAWLALTITAVSTLRRHRRATQLPLTGAGLV
jgi:membrane-associated phospholipid phosphatase